jgi:hypothetical protein
LLKFASGSPESESESTTPTPAPNQHILQTQPFYKVVQNFLQGNGDCKVDGLPETLAKLAEINQEMKHGCNYEKWESLIKPVYTALHKSPSAASNSSTCEALKAFLMAGSADSSLLLNLCFSKDFVMECGDGGECKCLEQSTVVKRRRSSSESHGKHQHGEHHLHFTSPVAENANTTTECKVGSDSQNDGVSNFSGQNLVFVLALSFIAHQLLR